MKEMTELKKDTLYKEIELENSQVLVIHDLSRKISADAWVVIMDARMEIRINKGLFVLEPVSEGKLADILDLLGDHIVYQYKVERNMIMDPDRETVFTNLVDTFLKNTGQYVCKPQFPEKLVIKEYNERIEKRKKYGKV